MDPIADLKPRSGKSPTMMKKHAINLEETEQACFLVLLANVYCKIAVIMNNDDFKRFKLKDHEVFIMKNLDFVEKVSDVPVFKVAQKTVIRESRVNKNIEALAFSTDEVNHLKTIDVENYLAGNVVDNSPPREVPAYEEIMSLYQYCSSIPSKLQPSQQVEVNEN